MRNLAVLGALLALLAQSTPAGAQDGSLGLTFSLEAAQVRTSDAYGLTMVFQVTNQLAEPLRWHPSYPFDDSSGRIVCLQGDNGRYFIASDSHKSSPSTEVTVVSAPGETFFLTALLNNFVETDANWMPIGTNDLGQLYAYSGPLPVGSYTVRVRYADGPPLNGAFPERSPAQGIYFSNVVQLACVDDATPNVPTPSAIQAANSWVPREDGLQPLGASFEKGGLVNSHLPSDRMLLPLFKHRGTEIADARILASAGVRLMAHEKSVELRRGKRSVTLPVPQFGKGLKLAKGGPPLPAFTVAGPNGGKPHYFVPIQYVAQQLGVTARYDLRKKRYHIAPAVAALPFVARVALGSQAVLRPIGN